MTELDQPTSEVAPAAPLAGRAKFVAAPLAVLWGTVPGVLGFVALGFIATIASWLRDLGSDGSGRGFLLYIALFAICSGLGLLPTYAMSLIGGWIFGVQWGLTGAIGGFVGGAIIGYGVSLLAGGPTLGRWFEHKPQVRVVRDALVGQGFARTLGVVTLLRIPPSSPFALMNLAMCAARVKLVPYIIGTAVGMTPRTAVAVYVAATAAAAGEKNFQTLAGKRPMEMIIGIAVTLVVLIILGQIGKMALRRAGITK